MASAWGNSWSNAWGNSWGGVAAPVVADDRGSGYGAAERAAALRRQSSRTITVSGFATAEVEFYEPRLGVVKPIVPPPVAAEPAEVSLPVPMLAVEAAAMLPRLFVAATVPCGDLGMTLFQSQQEDALLFGEELGEVDVFDPVT